MTTDDVFYVISVFEADINNHLEMEKSSKKKRNTPYMENYLSIQNKFFQFLANSNGMANEDLINKFTYELAVNKEMTLSTLSEDTRSYFASKYEGVSKYSEKSIRLMLNEK